MPPEEELLNQAIIGDQQGNKHTFSGVGNICGISTQLACT